MDGRSLVPVLVDPGHAAVAPATRAHIAQELARRGHADGAAAAAGWRDHHFVEYYSLGSVTRTGHLVDDPNSNTYRAIRSVSGEHGNLLYAEFTAVADWQFQNVSFHEIFDLDSDPHQLHNLYNTTSPAVRQQLAAQVAEQWRCAGTAGDNACP